MTTSNYTQGQVGGIARKSILWIGDAACPSGFAQATHHILDTLRHHYDVTVLAINYRGDPHEYPYPIWAAAAGGDMFGIGRLIWMCDKTKPDVIVVQNDGWNVPYYTQQLARFPEYKDIPLVAIVAVDGKNFQGDYLKGVSLAIFWTQFALDEARLGGYVGPAEVIPLGVDLNIYRPIDKYEARLRRLPKEFDDVFIVGNVNRNQWRKRWDLTVKYFAEWVNSRSVFDAYLYLHTAPTGDTGTNVKQLMRYYGVLDRLMLVEPPTFYGVSEDEMRDTYNCFDVQVSTTQGEGFGLTTLEGMACGIPQIVPNWSALGDWAQEAAELIECSSTAIGPPFVNVIGGIADERAFVGRLDDFYFDRESRARRAALGLTRASEDRFRWPAIGSRYVAALEAVLRPAERALKLAEETGRGLVKERLGPARNDERQAGQAKPLPAPARLVGGPTEAGLLEQGYAV